MGPMCAFHFCLPYPSLLLRGMVQNPLITCLAGGLRLQPERLFCRSLLFFLFFPFFPLFVPLPRRPGGPGLTIGLPRKWPQHFPMMPWSLPTILTCFSSGVKTPLRHLLPLSMRALLNGYFIGIKVGSIFITTFGAMFPINSRIHSAQISWSAMIVLPLCLLKSRTTPMNSTRCTRKKEDTC